MNSEENLNKLSSQINLLDYSQFWLRNKKLIAIFTLLDY